MYMCACFRRHVPQDADVIFLEYAVNDEHRKEPLFHNSARCAQRCMGPQPRGVVRGGTNPCA
jgi:hypothetical protein